MKVRALDHQHDWTFGRGRNDYLTKSDCIYQNVKTRLLSFVNDWFLDMDHGLPWLDCLEKPGDTGRIERMVKLQVLQTEGVEALDEFELYLDKDTRKVTIHLTYTDVYGQQQSMNSQPL